MRVIGLDPGPKQSALIVWDGQRISTSMLEENDSVLRFLSTRCGDPLAIEMIQSFGMPVGREVFQTVLWIGRFLQAYSPDGSEAHLVNRAEVKMHHCKSMRATDSTIRTALIDRFGGKQTAIGTSKSPGLFHGVKKDLWSALAIALYFYDTHGRSAS